jgi:C4-type Zn-finger protein
MDLSAEDRTRASEFLRAKAKNGCPFCGGETLVVEERLAEVRAYGSNMAMGAAILSCTDCGYNMLFNATRLGLDQ